MEPVPMNAVEVLLRLRAFGPNTPVLVSVPTSAGNRLLPVLSVHHHGLDPDEIDEERGGVELFTPAWGEGGGPPFSSNSVHEIVSRLERYREETHVRIAVPVRDHPGGAHHRILHIDLVGFGGSAGTEGVLPIELVTENWESLAQIIRMDEATSRQGGPK
jgi:hypothetical protein